MGCDIHLFTEAEKVIDGQKKWVNVDNWKVDHYDDSFTLRSAYDGRNYRVFAILAGVRNFREPLEAPICEARGLPKDVSDTVKKDSDKWGIDGHSHSWLTMRELLHYQAENSTRQQSGYISADSAKNLDNGIFPEYWNQGTSKEGYTWQQWERPGSHLDVLIEKLMPIYKDTFYIYSESQKLERIDNFRIVFWFDN